MKTDIELREDEFVGEPGHPQCGFFESFPSSPDPDETFFGVFFCHMAGTDKHAGICKGDYLKCPLAYGRSPFFSELNESTNSDTKQQTREDGSVDEPGSPSLDSGCTEACRYGSCDVWPCGEG